MNLLVGIMIPFIGTTLGAASVFFIGGKLQSGIQKILLGFAAGVMTAASVWSLLIPSMNMAENMGKLAFFPAAAGFFGGICFLLFMNGFVPHFYDNQQANNRKAQENFTDSPSLGRTVMMVLALTIHNIPEGMAVGVVFAGVLAEQAKITLAGAFALAVGIAIQNFPEGAIVSLPLNHEGMSKRRAFFCGAVSGVAEPISAGITLLLSSYIAPVLPYFLSFAAGAMIYVVVEELIPESSQGEHPAGTMGFAVGFALMMILYAALG